MSNDFIVGGKNDPFPTPDPDTELARALIDKHFGLPADYEWSKLQDDIAQALREARRQENEAVISIINTMCVKETPHGTLCKANYNDFMELCKAIRSRMKPENR